MYTLYDYNSITKPQLRITPSGSIIGNKHFLNCFFSTHLHASLGFPNNVYTKKVDKTAYVQITRKLA